MLKVNVKLHFLRNRNPLILSTYEKTFFVVKLYF